MNDSQLRDVKRDRSWWQSLVTWHPFDAAPAERLALLRILVGAYTLAYLATHVSLVGELARTDASQFHPVGILGWLSHPVSKDVAYDLFAVTCATTVLFTIGWCHRVVGWLHAGLLLVVLTYRNSWSMIYHSQNIVVLHSIILAFPAAADVWSVDAWQTVRRRDVRTREGSVASWRYGWLIWLLCAVTVTTYVLAGVAKVMGPLGWSWADGSALRDQIAVDAIRKEVLSVEPASPLAYWLYPHTWIFTLLGIGSLALELGAPIALVNRRLGMIWSALILSMHWGIYGVMGIVFRYQLAGLVIASFLPIERPIMRWLERRKPGRHDGVGHKVRGERKESTRNDKRTPATKPTWNWMTVVGWSTLVLLSLLYITAGRRDRALVITPHAEVAGRVAAPGAPDRAVVDAAIVRGTEYLTRHVDTQGRWIYRTYIDRPTEDRTGYNVLRHAGTIHALATVEATRPNDELREVIRAACRYLDLQIRWVKEHPQVLAVWSDVDEVDDEEVGSRGSVAKLGGTGLGLVALIESQRLEQRAATSDELSRWRALGDFLLVMQQPNGSFYSKWLDELHGPDTTWTSLYYPGEAALGLTLLFEETHDEKYLQSVWRALLYLESTRHDQTVLPADHWALLATRRVLQQVVLPATADQARMRDHAARIVRSILAEQQIRDPQAAVYGAFTPDGRIAPTATRLEGLLAANEILVGDEYATLRDELHRAIELGIRFLLAAQVESGPRRGGFPRAIGTLPATRRAEDAAFNRGASEIRIDYVQHTLSALLDYLPK